MPLQRTIESDDVIYNLDLVDPNLQLDLSSEPWNLKDGQASYVAGMDVLKPGGIRSARGRLPVGSSLAVADQPVVDAHGLDFTGATGIRVRGVANEQVFQHPSTQVSSFLNISDATYTDSTKNVESTGDFTNYTYISGDRFIVTAPSDNVGDYAIASKTDADNIVLDESAGPDATGTFDGAIYRRRGFHLIEPVSTIYTTGIVKNPLEYDVTGAWPLEIVGGYITWNGDERVADTGKFVRIAGRETAKNENDVILLAESVTASGNDKFFILYTKQFDKRGIWVTNGRKFWLLQGAAFVLYMDLGADVYLGLRWHMTRIANNLVLFVNDKYPPRVLRLDAGALASGATSGDETLAGLVTPVRSDESGTDRSWQMSADVNAGSIPTGDFKIKIRAVNLDDGAESEFVDVYKQTTSSKVLTVSTANSQIAVWSAGRATFAIWSPPVQDRYTHVEVWRTISNGSDYFLEHRSEIARLKNEVKEPDAVPRDYQLVGRAIDSGELNFQCTLSDADLVASGDILTNVEVLAGGHPPICRKSLSLFGVTICGGRALDTAVDPSVDARDFYEERFDYDSSNKRITATNGLGANHALFLNYTFVAGDRFEVTSGRTISKGIHDIDSKNDNNSIDLEDDIGTDTGGSDDAAGFIRRGYTIDWPKIESDEDIWYSRTDRFAPESFPLRTLKLSTIGDTLRSMVLVGNYAAVIMASGVHLLYFVGTTLTRDTVASHGFGTPWEFSVLVIGNNVIWATEEGPRMMVVSNSANIDGHRGVISFLDKEGRMRSWFRDAFENGDTIDAGLDKVNQCVRWRRSSDGNTFQALQLSLRTGRWSIEEDDSGLAYASSDFAETTPRPGFPLYSVTSQGAAFRVNYEGDADPYPGATVQAVTGDSYTVTHTRIESVGLFSTLMVGETVRFRSSNPSVNDAVRVIQTATADAITFDSLADLALGDEFVIGANRFRIKFASFRGANPAQVKVLDGLIVRALPGTRHTGTPEKSLTVRVYEDYAAEPVASKTVDIFDAGDTSKTDADRIVSLEAEGSSLEIEMENLDARTDFRLELVQARISEEGDIDVDRSESA